jgi:DNA-binding CsgD family transcriptional regulator
MTAEEAGISRVKTPPFSSIISYHGDFVGRTRELVSLDAMLAQVTRGMGGIATLVGEAGMGKTRTAEEFADNARKRDVPVYWGRCWEGEECPVLGPWTEALAAFIRANDAGTLRATMGHAAEDIACILPEFRGKLGAPAAPLALDSMDGARRLFGSILRPLCSASLRRPLVIIIDNLHLADETSLRFLRHLGPELERSRLLIVATCRTPAEAPREALALTLKELAKVRVFLSLSLEGLGKDEVRAIVGGALHEGASREVADRIHARSGGNPFFVLELLRQECVLPAAGMEEGTLPEGIRQVIGGRLGRLSDACRRLLATAAVLGQTFDVEPLIRTGGAGATDSPSILLDEAAGSAVIQAAGPGGMTFRFAHDLVREVLLDGIPAAEKARLHERAAAALEEIQAFDPRHLAVEILHHLLQGGINTQPLRIVEYCGRAADDAMERYAPDEALRIIDMTLDAWKRIGRAFDARVAPLLHRRGRLCTELMQPIPAKENLVHAFGLYLEDGNRGAAIDVALTPSLENPGGQVWMSSVGGGGRGVSELRERAFALVAAGSRDHAMLLQQRGSRADLRTALGFTRTAGERRLEAKVLSQLAYHELLAWDFDASARWLASAETAVAREGDHTLEQVCAYTRWYHGLFTGNAEILSLATSQLFDLGRRTRSLRAQSAAHRCAAIRASKRGDWDEARREAREGIALLRSSGPVFNLEQCHEALLEAELQTGHFKAARAVMESAAAMGVPIGGTDIRSTLLGARISSDASLVPEPRAVVAIPDAAGSLMTFVPVELFYNAECALLHAHPAVASVSYERLRKWQGTCFTWSTDALLGRLCMVLNRPDSAVGHFEQGAAFCRRAGYLPDLAWTLADFAEAVARRDETGDHEHAAQLLAESLSLCEELGMNPLKSRVRAAMQALAGGVHRRRADPDGLTRREIEILRLIARGYTNAEIADRLTVSALTVAKHVHNLLDKTGMANRAEVTAWAGRTGLLQAGRQCDLRRQQDISGR